MFRFKDGRVIQNTSLLFIHIPPALADYTPLLFEVTIGAS